MTRPRLFHETIVALSGPAAQERWFGENGMDETAEPDLKQATQYAKDAVERFAMDEQNPTPVHQPTLVEKALPDKLFNAVEDWLAKAFSEAKEVVEREAERIESLAKALYKSEELSGADLQRASGQSRT